MSSKQFLCLPCIRSQCHMPNHSTTPQKDNTVQDPLNVKMKAIEHAIHLCWRNEPSHHTRNKNPIHFQKKNFVGEQQQLCFLKIFHFYKLLCRLNNSYRYYDLFGDIKIQDHLHKFCILVGQGPITLELTSILPFQPFQTKNGDI